MKKTQKVELVFEKNGTNWGLSSDVIKHTLELPLPVNGFDVGVHLIGARVGDTINMSDDNSAGSEQTGYVPMIAELVNQKDVESIVGAVLTIVDATITDKDQRKAFKSLIKQAIYGRYNAILEKSYQTVGARAYRIETNTLIPAEPTHITE